MPTGYDIIHGWETVRLVHMDLPTDLRGHDDSLAMMNRALGIYANAKTVIRDASKKHREQMEDDFDDVVTEGSGWGISDFEEAIDHLAERADKNRTPWWSDRNYASFERTLVPESFAVFLRQLKKRGMNVHARLGQIDRLVETALRQKGNQDWAKLSATMGQINSVSGKLKKVSWMLPESKFQDIFDRSTKHAGNITTAFDVFARAANVIAIAQRGDVGDTAFAALEEVVSFVPIFGSIYGGALSAVPGMKAQVQNYVDRKHQAIERFQRFADQ